jgi:uncharacterized protein (DUF2225 family)
LKQNDISKEMTMKNYEEKVSLTCDLCGLKIYQRFNNWDKGFLIVAETKVSMKTGNTYPEGGSVTEVGVDICPDCFNEKLIPWLKSQGAKITETEYDT